MRVLTQPVLASCLLISLWLWPGQGYAGPIAGDMAGSTEGLASYTGLLTYTATSSTAATLQVQLTNTTSPTIGGYLTGFVFNNPGAAITGVTFSGSHPEFLLLGGPTFQNSISGSPYGLFDIGAAIGGDWLGGGNPSTGLAVGTTGTFTFGLTGSGLDALSQASFESEFSVPPGGECCEFFVARFRGLENGGSDKVPALAVPGLPNGGAPVIPEPSTVLLVASGLAGLGLWRRRQTHQEHIG